MSQARQCEQCKHYEKALGQLEAKVDLLVGELIEGNKDLGRPGHIRQTEARLGELERRMERQLSPEQVELISRAINITGSYRFVFGMLLTTILALTGVASMVLHFIKFLRGG